VRTISATASARNLEESIRGMASVTIKPAMTRTIIISMIVNAGRAPNSGRQRRVLLNGDIGIDVDTAGKQGALITKVLAETIPARRTPAVIARARIVTNSYRRLGR
jgi:hypothetical protein